MSLADTISGDPPFQRSGLRARIVLGLASSVLMTAALLKLAGWTILKSHSVA